MSDIETLLDNPVRFIPPEGTTAEWGPVPSWTREDWVHWLREHNRFDYLPQWSEERILRYVDHERYYYGLGWGKPGAKSYQDMHWFYNPTPVAVPFHACKVPNVLFGGAAGGSKSYSTRYDIYRHLFSVPKFNALLMRRTFEELERNHLKDVRRERDVFNEFFGKEIVKYVEQRHEMTICCHGTGLDSMVTFGHCQNEGDEEKYLGPAYDEAALDEAVSFTKKQIIGVAGRLRSEKRGVLARLVLPTNPAGAFSLWLKEWYIDKDEAQIREENPKYRADRYQFIPAMLYDNPYYMDPDGTYTNYEERLFAYDPERRKQLLLGDWSALTGQFFPEFKAPLSGALRSKHVEAIFIPPGCKIERWVDWGYDPHYGVCYWVACFPNGRLYVFYEYKFNGAQAKQKMVASEVATKIRTYTVDEVLPLVQSRRITRSVADPSMWGKDGHSGEDYAETFQKNGVNLTRADNDRVLGWGRLRAWFRDAPDGYPWLMIHPRCTTLIRTIPALVRDESDPDDLNTTGEDHPADCLRYGVMARPTPTRFVADSPIILDGSIAHLIKAERQSSIRQVGQIS